MGCGENKKLDKNLVGNHEPGLAVAHTLYKRKRFQPDSPRLLNLTYQHDYNTKRFTWTLTGDACIASNMASRMGLMSDTGGVTPHIRTRRLLAREARVLLSFTWDKISAFVILGEN